jgi:hypothetical protein
MANQPPNQSSDDLEAAAEADYKNVVAPPEAYTQPQLAGAVIPVAAMPTLAEPRDIAHVIEQAGAYMELHDKMRKMAIRLTNHTDWIDERGTPYLQWSGSSKVARAFGVSYDSPRWEKEKIIDDRGEYIIFKCETTVRWNGQEVPELGTGTTRDEFFSVAWVNKTDATGRWIKDSNGKCIKEKKVLPLSEIDLTDIQKKALTNCLNRGIRDLLGLRYTWEDIAQYSEGRITKDKCLGLKFDGQDKERQKPAAPVAPSAPNPPPAGAVVPDVKTPAPTPASPVAQPIPSTPANPPISGSACAYISEEHTNLTYEQKAQWLKDEMWKRLVFMYGEAGAANQLEEMTTFQGDRGLVSGKRSMDNLTDRQAYRLSHALKTLIEVYNKAVG